MAEEWVYNLRDAIIRQASEDYLEGDIIDRNSAAVFFMSDFFATMNCSRLTGGEILKKLEALRRDSCGT